MIEGLLSQVSTWATQGLGFLFVLGAVVFFHELGHFLVARWCGVTVTTFSIGFGKELAAFVDRKGTRWRIAAIPHGGYVKILDNAKAASPGPAETTATTPEHKTGTPHQKPLSHSNTLHTAATIANVIP